MRDDPAPRWLAHAVCALALLGLVLLLAGCVTVKECGVGIKHRLLLAECAWCSGRPC